MNYWFSSHLNFARLIRKLNYYQKIIQIGKYAQEKLSVISTYTDITDVIHITLV
jgi:hypothetical protein